MGITLTNIQALLVLDLLQGEINAVDTALRHLEEYHKGYRNNPGLGEKMCYGLKLEDYKKEVEELIRVLNPIKN